jgi:hypothetical protein
MSMAEGGFHEALELLLTGRFMVRVHAREPAQLPTSALLPATTHGTGPVATRGGRPVIEPECGITV